MKQFLLTLFSTTLLLSACGRAEETSADNPGSQPGSFDQLRIIRYRPTAPLEDFLSEVKVYYQLPGIAAALVEHGRVTEQAVVGTNKAIAGTALMPDSKFQIASCGKSITALLAGTFVQDGVLSWDTRMVDIFPQWEEEMLPHYRAVTLRQLLSHTAGMLPFSSDEDYFKVFDLVPGLGGELSQQRRQFARWNFSQAPAGETGEFLYSNGGYVVVAARGANDSYALGWAIRTIDGTTVSTHSGSDQTVFAMMSIDPSSDSAAVVVTNIGGQRSEFALINVMLELLH